MLHRLFIEVLYTPYYRFHSMLSGPIKGKQLLQHVIIDQYYTGGFISSIKVSHLHVSIAN